MTDLGTLGGKSSRANGINALGAIVGAAEVKRGTMHAFVYKAGAMHDLGTLGYPVSEARGINRRGQIVGDVWVTADVRHAFIYEGGKMHDLNKEIDPHSGWLLSIAHAINNSGRIVGVGTIKGEEHGFLLVPIAN